MDNRFLMAWYRPNEVLLDQIFMQRWGLVMMHSEPSAAGSLTAPFPQGVKPAFDSWIIFWYAGPISRPLRIQYPDAWYHGRNTGHYWLGQILPMLFKRGGEVDLFQKRLLPAVACDSPAQHPPIQESAVAR